MAIYIKSKHEVLILYAQYTGELDNCYYCQEPVSLEEGVVFWAGQSNIVLHEDCADKFAVNLMKDAAELRMARRKGQ